MASPAQRMGFQPAASTAPRGFSRVKKPNIRVDDETAKPALERAQSTFQPSSGDAPQRDWGAMITPPASMGPYALPAPAYGQEIIPGMGPNATGAWKDGPLGAVPKHHGWAGLQPTTKVWALRIMGAFPGLRFSSGYRTPAQNAAVNGDPRSGHMQGWKIDLSGSPLMLKQAALWAKSYGAKTLLHDAGSGYHLDISWRGVGL